jgi:hypothetical protein
MRTRQFSRAAEIGAFLAMEAAALLVTAVVGAATLVAAAVHHTGPAAKRP